jgi:hypothetical protein
LRRGMGRSIPGRFSVHTRRCGRKARPSGHWGY